MALTRNFRDTVKARVQRDPAFGRALLVRSVQAMLEGDVESGKAVLRDYINATVGFQTLARDVEKTPESIMRMLGPSGNPNTSNLMSIIAHLQKTEGFHLQVRAVR
jgi:DNA-binding phage protein